MARPNTIDMLGLTRETGGSRPPPPGVVDYCSTHHEFTFQ